MPPHLGSLLLLGAIKKFKVAFKYAFHNSWMQAVEL